MMQDIPNNTPRALDLFCCAGGATRGLQRAGYHVTGVDIRPQPRYVGDVFHQDDAMAWLRGERESLTHFDLIWMSPPCQRYQKLNTTRREAHPDLLPEALELARALDVPYIAENVDGAQVYMRSPIMLCGTMFGLNIWRHRWFEIGNSDAFFLLPPCNHSGKPVLISGVTRRKGEHRRENIASEKRDAIGIDWMIVKELDDAIPPAYSQFLAEHMQRVAESVR
jgi:DNA (cytosine-5)-methyltransferase 1